MWVWLLHAEGGSGCGVYQHEHFRDPSVPLFEHLPDVSEQCSIPDQNRRMCVAGQGGEGTCGLSYELEEGALGNCPSREILSV